MTALAVTDELFFNKAGLERSRVEAIVEDSLAGADDGELFLEYRQTERFMFDDGRFKTAGFDISQGFGLRAIAGACTGYSHACELSEAAIRRASEMVKTVRVGHSGKSAAPSGGTNPSLYTDDNPLNLVDFERKVQLLADMDAYARAKDVRVRQVRASLSGHWQAVQIIRPDGHRVADLRPLVRLNVSVEVEKGGRMETGVTGAGGRVTYARYLEPETWRAIVDEALHRALVNLESIPAPTGDMPVILGPGWPGILLHEAIGHGLEGDFNRKKTSAFSGLMGQRIAAPGVTVVDDGTIEASRGSLTVDDEGTLTRSTVLIEDGILRAHMQDRMNARLMGAAASGNGRREGFAHTPMPRMTNTYMRAGSHDPEEIIGSVKKGLYAVHFSGGQVDITAGKFVFSCTEAYLVEDGKVGPAVKGATLIGSGPDVLTKVSMIGTDMELDPGIGTCGKEGQDVPVGVGQPTIKVDSLIVGGTAV